MNDPAEIGPDISIEELVDRFPRSVSFLMERGVVCIKCGEPAWGALGNFIANAGLDVPETIAELKKYLLEGA
jgi:hypothetical protein